MGKQTNPRFITAAEDLARNSNVSVIDLGIIRAADVYAAGYIELLPAVENQIIKAVRFLSDYLDNSDGVSQLTFTTGNAAAGGDSFGIAQFGGTTGDTLYTPTLASSHLCTGDCGPLGVISGLMAGGGFRFLPWTPNTKYCQGDLVIGSGHAQKCNPFNTPSQGGTSGSTEPTWDTSGGFVNDGTIEWDDMGDITPETSGYTATVHAIAEVVTLDTDIPRPVSLQFIQQPTNVVAGVAFDPSIKVLILDQNGQAFKAQSVRLDLAFHGEGYFSTGAPVVQMASDVTTGISDFGIIDTIPNVALTPGTYRLIAKIEDTWRSTFYRLASDPFDVTAP